MTAELKRDLELVGREIQVRGEKIKKLQDELNADPKYVALRKQIKDHKVARNLNIVEAHQRIVLDKEDAGCTWEEWCVRYKLSFQQVCNIVRKHYLQLEPGKINGEFYPDEGVDCDEDEEKPAGLLGTEVKQDRAALTGEQIKQWRTVEVLSLFGTVAKEVKAIGYFEEATERYIEPLYTEAWQRDPVDRIMARVERLSPSDLQRLVVKIKEYGKKLKTPPKTEYTEDDFTGIVVKPVDPRVQNAIDHFFGDVPETKRVWVQQRMEEQPSAMKAQGVHIDWINAYWDSDPDTQRAIKQGIKDENTRRMEW